MALPAGAVRKKVNEMPYISQYTFDHLKSICTVNHMDISGATKKQEVLDIILKFDAIIDPIADVAVPKQKSKEKHLENVPQFEEEKHEISTWLDIVRRQLKRQKFAYEDWSYELEPLLTGRAQLAFSHMREDEKDDFESIAKVILKAFNISEESYRLKFRNERKKKDQTFYEFGNYLLQLATRWLNPDKTLKDSAEFKRILELLTVEQIITSVLDDNLKRRLREIETKTLAKVTEKADSFVNAKTYGHSRSGDSGWKPGKEVKDEESKKDSSGEKGKNESSASEDKQNTPFPFNCYNCNEKGHKFFECDKPRKPRERTDEKGAGAVLKHKSGIYANCKLNTSNIFAYIDNGSTDSIMNFGTAKRLGLDICDANVDYNLTTVNNGKIRIYGTVNAKLEIGDSEIEHVFIVADIRRSLLIGCDILHEKLGVTLNLGKMEFSVASSDIKFPLINRNSRKTCKSANMSDSEDSDGEMISSVRKTETNTSKFGLSTYGNAKYVPVHMRVPSHVAEYHSNISELYG